jgi:ubiquinone/menaquinone biosynthesis C-methylase UbiE
MAEPSIARARRAGPHPAGTVSARGDALPLPDASADAVFLILAAHELRRADDRRALFREVGRILRAGGRLVLVEHLRDPANFLAFGPGSGHFYPRREWLGATREAGLTLHREIALTPFVRCLTFTPGRRVGPDGPPMADGRPTAR